MYSHMREAQEVEVAGGLKMGAKSLCVPIEDSASALCQSRIPVQCRQGQSVFQPEWTTCLGPSQLSNASAGFAWLWI